MDEFITSTTYGQWLLGDKRGFVGHVDGRINNKFDEPYDADVAWLRKYSKDQLKGEPVLLNAEQAGMLLEQFRQTVEYRGWTMYGVAIMPNHFHILLEVPDDADVAKVAKDLKSYGSRRLNAVFGKPDSGTWWTQSSSARRKKASSIPYLIRYMKEPQYDE